MKVFSGKVISTKMTKTATVAVESVVVHPVYRKRYKTIKKYHVHDELGTQVGQTVRFTDSRPFSKLKKWRVLSVIEKPHQGKKQSTSKPEAKSVADKKTKSVKSVKVRAKAKKKKA